MAKKKRKQGFCHPLLERRKRVTEERGQVSKKHHHFYSVFGGGLKNGQEVVPPFGATKFHAWKSSKTPICKKNPGKAGGNHFFGKRLC